MVGKKIGVFVAIEVKSKSGKLSEQQVDFLAFIKNAGGFSGVARSIEDASEIVNNTTK
jgi:hypothetical protein